MVAMSNSAAFAEAAAPPTERDLQLYEAVAVVGLSSRTAAAVFGISQTRVLQVRQRMEEWIGRYVPRSVETLSPRERLIVAADLADRRSQMLFSEAMEAWRASQDAARERCTANDRHIGPSMRAPWLGTVHLWPPNRRLRPRTGRTPIAQLPMSKRLTTSRKPGGGHFWQPSKLKQPLFTRRGRI
jgi:hypothetical protein